MAKAIALNLSITKKKNIIEKDRASEQINELEKDSKHKQNYKIWSPYDKTA